MFVTIEGPEGSGKSSVTKEVVKSQVKPEVVRKSVLRATIRQGSGVASEGLGLETTTVHQAIDLGTTTHAAVDLGTKSSTATS